MNQNQTHLVTCPIGQFYLKINSDNHAYITTNPNGYNATVLIVRRVDYGNVSLHLEMKNGQFYAQGYEFDGNTKKLVSLVTTPDYFKTRAIHVASKFIGKEFVEATNSAKVRLFDEILMAANAYYIQNKMQMDGEFLAARIDTLASDRNKLAEKHAELKEEQNKIQAEINAIDHELDEITRTKK